MKILRNKRKKVTKNNYEIILMNQTTISDLFLFRKKYLSKKLINN